MAADGPTASTHALDMGPMFPHGMFVCQDNTNNDPAAGNQNFKFVPLERVVGLTGEPEKPLPKIFVPNSTIYFTASGSVSGSEITSIRCK